MAHNDPLGALPMEDLLLMDEFYATAERSLWHPPTGTIIIADLHLGFEEEMMRRGNLMPALTAKHMQDAWDRIVARGPQHIVLAGDLFHTNAPSEETWKTAIGLLQSASENGRVTVIPGNHDPDITQLKKRLEDTRFEVAESALIAGWRIMHGHALAAALGTDRV